MADKETETTTKKTAPSVVKRIQHQKKRFLEYYNKTRNVRKACEAVGIHHKTLYRWKREDKEFELDIFEAKESWVDDLEESMQNIALNGEKTPIVVRDENGSQKIGWWYKRNTAISIFMLKYNRKSIYLPESGLTETTADEMAHKIRESLDAMLETVPGADV
jgi:transposase-like protein